jgi:hypothetical protein
MGHREGSDCLSGLVVDLSGKTAMDKGGGFHRVLRIFIYCKREM